MLIIFLLRFSCAREIFNGNDTACADAFIGDGICDYSCMIDSRKFDSKSTSDSAFDLLLASDCLFECFDANCNFLSLEYEYCDPTCDIPQCGYGLGQCSYCSSGCTIQLLENSIQDPICNTETCKYDNNQYGWCADGCFKEDLEGSEFIPACNVSSCDFQNGLGLTYQCSQGCTLIMLLNDYCDELCNTESCNFDMNFCLCAEECTQTVIDSDSCEDTDPCINESCQFKYGKCGYCAAFCLENMIGNGECNDECNNENCEFDKGDCSCAPGCESRFENGEWSQIDECKSECLVESCMFNYLVCADSGLLRLAVIYHTLTISYDSFDLSLCNCTIEELSLFTLDAPCGSENKCNTQECFFCFGYAEPLDSPDCVAYKNGACLFEKSKTYLYGIEFDLTSDTSTIPLAQYSTYEKINELFDPSIKLYFLNPGLYKKNAPYTRNFEETLDSNQQVSKILAEATTPYCIFTLPNGEYTFSPMDLPYNYIYTNNGFSPLSFNIPFTRLKEFTIQGSTSDSTIIYFYSGMTLASSAAKVYIKNIIFSGEKLLDPSCEVETCFYCPFLFDKGRLIYLTDRYKFLIDPSGYVLPCDTNENSVLFDVTGLIYIEKVVFSNIRNQFLSLIRSASSVFISDSEFVKIQPSASGAVITVVCISNCAGVTVQITFVNVTDFNYGYEVTSFTDQGKFLYVSNVGDVTLTNVDFKYDMAYSCSDCILNPFIYISAIQGKFAIESCNFQYIYAGTLIYIDAVETLYEQFTLDVYHRRYELFQTHVSIKNTNFLNIYTSFYLIQFEMGLIRQNMVVENCNFNSISAGNGLIKINGIDPTDDTENTGKWEYIISNNIRHYVYFPSRSILLSNIVFNDIRYSKYILDIEYYSNVIMDAVTFFNSNEGEITDVYFYAIKYFSEADKYLKSLPFESELFQKECYGVINLQSIYFASLTSIAIDFCSCNSDKMTHINAEIMELLLITDYKALNIIGYTLNGIALNTVNVNSIKITGFALTEMINYYGPIVKIETTETLEIENAYLEYIKSFSLPSISLVYLSDIEFTNFTCKNCISEYGNGGALMVVMGLSGKRFNMNSVVFINCMAQYGEGSVLYLDSISIVIPISILFSDIRIENSKAFSGIIVLSSRINFASALFSDLTILNSSSYADALIRDSHLFGLLAFKNFYSSGNSAPISSIQGYYTIADVLLSLQNVIIENDNPQTSMFYFKSIEKAIIYIENIKIQNTAATAFELEKIILIGKNLYISDAETCLKLSTAVAYITGANLDFTISNTISLASSTFTCTDCLFQNSNATSISGTISLVIITNSQFQNCSSSDYSIASLSSEYTLQSTFINCTFTNNAVSLITVFMAYLRIVDCKFSNNTFGSTIVSYASMLIIFNSAFTDDTTAYINSDLGSSVYIISSNFSDAVSGPALSGKDFTVLQISNSIFSNLHSAKLGGAIFIYSSSNVSIENCSFINTTSSNGDSITLDSTFATISLCNFSDLQTAKSDSGIIHANGGSLNITRSNFSNISGKSSAVYANSLMSLSVVSSKFENISSDEGSGIFALGNSGTVFLSDCVFINNTAMVKGGAISVSNSYLKVTDTLIEKNTGRAEWRWNLL